MGLTTKQIKQRYFDKTYEAAPMVLCKCGCKTPMKSVDKYARPIEYINGHNGRKYNDPKQYKREWNHRNQEARYEYKEKFQRDRKVKLLLLKGGECEECKTKYDGDNACIFDFHHKSPKDKDFQLNLSKMGRAWDTILKEVDKCRLMCSNCHRRKHSIKF